MKNLGPPDGTASAKPGHRECSGIPLTSKRSVMWFRLKTRKKKLTVEGWILCPCPCWGIYYLFRGLYLVLGAVSLPFLFFCCLLWVTAIEDYGLRWRGSVGTRDLLFPLFSPHWSKTTNRTGILVFVALSFFVAFFTLLSCVLKAWKGRWDGSLCGIIIQDDTTESIKKSIILVIHDSLTARKSKSL